MVGVRGVGGGLGKGGSGQGVVGSLGCCGIMEFGV